MINDAAAFAAARQVCRRHARSFYFASHFLPRERRAAAYAVYAFCRQMDDAVDEVDSIEMARHNLKEFRERISAAYRSPSMSARSKDLPPSTVPAAQKDEDSRPQSLSRSAGGVRLHIDRAFKVTIRKYEIPQQPFLELLAGCEMDLTVDRYKSWPDLELYCYRVAGVVGLIMSQVFGLDHEDAQRQAVLMGNAMQLTNILRDVGEDFSTRGRIYLPLDELDRFGYTADQLSRGVVNTAFIELMRFQIARARQMFFDASGGLCWLPNDGSRLTAATMAVIYSGILDAIERQNYDVFARRARLTLSQKIRRLPRSWKLSRRQPGAPLIDAFAVT